MTVYIKRYPSKGELPKRNGYYLTQVGVVHFRGWFNNWIEYWLEEIELPSEEEIAEASEKRLKKLGEYQWIREHDFEMGAHYILGFINNKK